MSSWYSTYTNGSTNITKQAEFKDSLSSIIFAISLILGGSEISEAAQKANVEPTVVEQAMTNPSLVEQAKSQQFSLDTIIAHILEHENLLPKQTPFRITNPKMREWNHIYGFDIDRNTANVPPNRRNFIFLKNPEDVQKAVRILFNKYKSVPRKYKLPANPSLKDAIKKFDQTGATGKIEELKRKMPGINMDAPLSDFR